MYDAPFKHGFNKLYIPRRLADHHSLNDGDWVTLTSRAGEIKAPVKVMDGINDKTVWTWNAIGKRRGTWNLPKNAREATDGFLLNHLIDDLLPEQAGGYRYANADPITGQAAWYDLRVQIAKTKYEEGLSQPQFKPLSPPASISYRPKILRYGKGTQK